MLAHTLFQVTLHYVASLELLPAELAGIAGGDATLVAEVPGDGVLVLVGPAALVTTVQQVLSLADSQVRLIRVHQRGNLLGFTWTTNFDKTSQSVCNI